MSQYIIINRKLSTKMHTDVLIKTMTIFPFYDMLIYFECVLLLTISPTILRNLSVVTNRPGQKHIFGNTTCVNIATIL